MEPFTTLTAGAVPMDLPNIDTDRVIPARFLKQAQGVRPRRATSSTRALQSRRIGERGLHPQPGPLPGRAGPGHRRELRLWLVAGVGGGALMGAGFRCAIGPSFGDIFFENCFKNGVLAVVLPADMVAELRRQLHARPGATISVDLASQTLTAPDGSAHRLEVMDPFRKQALLRGQDEIALTLEYAREIEAFEARHAVGDAVARPADRRVVTQLMRDRVGARA